MTTPTSTTGDHEPSPADMRHFTLADPPEGFAADPYPWYAALRRHAPVHELGAGSVLLTRHDDVSAVYRSDAVSSDKRVEFAPKLGPGTPIYEHHTTSLVFNDPPLHTRVRRLLMGALTQRVITRMEAGVIALVDGLLDEMEDKRRAAPIANPGADPVDLIADFAARIPVEVIGNLLDVPRSERAPLQGWSLAILSALEPRPAADVLDRANRATREFLDYLDGLVAHRTLHPGDPEVDVLTRLIVGERPAAGNNNDGGGRPREKLSRVELLHNCIFMLNAGHETTTNLIGNGMHALLEHPDQLERLRREPALITTAVEELLRFDSPLQLNNRVTTAPIELRGHTLPTGTFVTLGIGAANRDPEAFDDPDRLDLARKPNPHVAFGHGAHACAGMNVARLEARIAIPRLIARFTKLARSGAPERDARIRFRGLRRLPVALR